MHRRNLLTVTLGALGLATPAAIQRANAAERAAPDKSKVVYHLADLDKVQFVLGNIRNHFDGAGGPEKVTIALVVHGPALKAFQVSAANPDMKKRVAEFTKAGLEMSACGRTMQASKITLADLLPGFVAAEQGGVVRIAELQSEGYVYLRP
jgi:intracellular sulfur oxidation DsrE/DsrF family protein